jgi:hypothetical protein
MAISGECPIFRLRWSKLRRRPLERSKGAMAKTKNNLLKCHKTHLNAPCLFQSNHLINHVKSQYFPCVFCDPWEFASHLHVKRHLHSRMWMYPQMPPAGRWLKSTIHRWRCHWEICRVNSPASHVWWHRRVRRKKERGIIAKMGILRIQGCKRCENFENDIIRTLLTCVLKKGYVWFVVLHPMQWQWCFQHGVWSIPIEVL